MAPDDEVQYSKTMHTPIHIFLHLRFFLPLILVLVQTDIVGKETNISNGISKNYHAIYSMHFGHEGNSEAPDDATIDVLANEQHQKEFIQFCAAPHGISNRSIRRVTFNPGWHGFNAISKNDAAMRRMVTNLHLADIEVFVATGAPIWADEGSLEIANRILDNLLNYNRKASPSERFDGIHLDIEPYTLGTQTWHKLRWKEHFEQIWNNYLQVLDFSRSKVEKYKTQTQHSLELVEAIPHWYLDKTNAETFQGSFQEVIDRVDSVWIMAYHDTAKLIINSVKDEINYAGTINKEITVGLLVHGEDPLYSPPDNETFIQEGNKALNLAIDQIETHFKQHPALSEIGIFIYESYIRLK